MLDANHAVCARLLLMLQLICYITFVHFVGLPTGEQLSQHDLLQLWCRVLQKTKLWAKCQLAARKLRTRKRKTGYWSQKSGYPQYSDVNNAARLVDLLQRVLDVGVRLKASSWLCLGTHAALAGSCVLGVEQYRPLATSTQCYRLGRCCMLHTF